MAIIYKPKGKAAEYAPWAANFYNGCSNRCEYCYNRHCQAKALLGKDEPTLKKAFKDEDQAFEAFRKELRRKANQIRWDGGLFFNFVSDPCLSETWKLNLNCIRYAILIGVPCRVLTKRAEAARILDPYNVFLSEDDYDYLKVGFTLTGRDDLEPGASTNAERIEAMKALHEKGVSTWASIEPVIDIMASAKMIADSVEWCDEYRIGLLSGKKTYTPAQIKEWMAATERLVVKTYRRKLIWKDSVLKFVEKA